MKTPAEHENVLTLANALGIDEGRAVTLLSSGVAVTPGPRECDQFCADLITSLLRRTFAEVGADVSAVAVEVVVGDAPRRTEALVAVFVQMDSTRAIIGHDRPGSPSGADVHRVLCLLTACYAAATVTRSIVGSTIAPARYPIVVDLAELLGEDLPALRRTTEFGVAFLAGAGAIGNSILLGLSCLNTSGTLLVADPDSVSAGNLNRCFYFSDLDIRHPKAAALCERAGPEVPRVRLVPHAARLQDVPGADHIERLIVAVDSRRARRHLQEQIPRTVFDASTTGIAEVVLHFNDVSQRQHACLSCVYRAEAVEDAHERHVAEALGVSVADVRTHHIDARAAAAIKTKYPSLSNIEGEAYDTLFKQLCGQQLLSGPQGARVLAPFAFVSVLAGAFLALEFVRRCARGDAVAPFNYWRASPWTNPVMALRQVRAAEPTCTFCRDPVLKQVADELWPLTASAVTEEGSAAAS
jgi:hypothetical protein